MKKWVAIGSIACLITIFGMCRKPQPFKDEDYDQRLSGGMATVFDETSKAFGKSIPALSAYNQFVFSKGDKAFSASFVAAPAKVFGGLGPIYNNVSCISCHHNDGKGTPTTGQINSSILLRISIPGADAHGGPLPAGGFGNQLQDKGLFGVQPEVKVNITYTDVVVAYPDGSSVTLRKPSYELQNAYAALPSVYSISPRMAPPVFGLGLLEAIPENTILGFADENDRDGDGIKGHPNYVYNPHTKRIELGRFGLKANTSTLEVQVATAYQQDMGVTNRIQPVKNAYGQPQMSYITDPDVIDLPDSTLNDVTFYTRSLAVPARRNVADPVILRGQALFAQINCTGCHRPVVFTGYHPTLAALSNQRIQPYTDLLLHDMGEGLADGYADYRASGSEWRTTPLWGIGLFEKTNGIPYYLHDGRARTIEEAILWHGGEAERARKGFMQLSAADRAAVIKFIRSL